MSNSLTNQTSLSNNFFQLFNLDVSFSIDETALQLKFRELQKQYHPDNFFDDLSNNNRQHHQNISALINKAFDTLKKPDTRAAHLLEINGHIINWNESISDLDFLDEAMELRIDLDDALLQKNLSELKNIEILLVKKIDYLSYQFNENFMNNHIDESIILVKKLKFLMKIKNDVSKGFDDIAANNTENDDDLYV